MERIVFNSDGKAKTMDLAKLWLRARLEELVQEMRAEFQRSDSTEPVREEFSHGPNANISGLGGAVPGAN
jgi:hypothetical protein